MRRTSPLARHYFDVSPATFDLPWIVSNLLQRSRSRLSSDPLPSPVNPLHFTNYDYFCSSSSISLSLSLTFLFPSISCVSALSFELLPIIMDPHLSCASLNLPSCVFFDCEREKTTWSKEYEGPYYYYLFYHTDLCVVWRVWNVYLYLSTPSFPHTWWPIRRGGGGSSNSICSSFWRAFHLVDGCVSLWHTSSPVGLIHRSRFCPFMEYSKWNMDVRYGISNILSHRRVILVNTSMMGRTLPRRIDYHYVRLYSWALWQK